MADLEFAQNAAPETVTIALSTEQEARYERITRNLQEVTSGDIIRKVLADGETPRAYWGTATTGRPHIAYCVPLMKIADFLNAGVHVKILLADLHAFLDANKSTMDTLKYRVKYYSHLLHAVFTTLGVPTDKLEFVTGTSYQLTAEYTLDMYKWVYYPARPALTPGSTPLPPSRPPSTPVPTSSRSPSRPSCRRSSTLVSRPLTSSTSMSTCSLAVSTR